MCPAGKRKISKPEGELGVKKKTTTLFFFSDVWSLQILKLCFSPNRKKSAWQSQNQLSLPSSSMLFHLPSWFWLVPLTQDTISVPKDTFGRQTVAAAGESLEFGQLGFLAGAIPLPCPVYLKHRDYSCSRCQQRASFRLSPLHSMTSAGPSHLQHKTHNEWESVLHICIRRNAQKQHTVI